MFSLFTKKQPQPVDDESVLPSQKKSGRLTQDGVRSLYPNNASFIDFLPWVEYLPESQSLLLDDGFSVGAVFEVVPVGTEGRTGERLEEIRDIVEDALQTALTSGTAIRGSFSSSVRMKLM